MRAFLALVLAIPLAADPSTRFDRLLGHLMDSSGSLGHAFVGMRVVRLSDGRVLFARNAERLFVPASNMKLFTTALALSRLGPDYRLATKICAAAPIDAEGTLAGDLDLIGGGDPSLSGRQYPYRNHAPPMANYSFHAVEDLADQLVARGLKRVQGNIVGDDTRYVWEPQPGPWSSENAIRDYGAPVSALILNDNSFAMTLRPGTRAGDLARLTLTPPFENFVIDNRVVTTERGEPKIEFYRSPSGGELHVWGMIPKGEAGYTHELAIGDPALYAAQVLRDALLRRGIAIRGEGVVRHRFPDESVTAAGQAPLGAEGTLLAEHHSPPLLDVLQVVDKVSQNLHAEVLLREVAVGSGQRGGGEAAVASGHPGNREAVVGSSPPQSRESAAGSGNPGSRKAAVGSSLPRSRESAAASGSPGSREAGLAVMDEFLTSIGISRGEYQFTDGSGLSRSTLVSPLAITKLLVHMYGSPHRDEWLNLLPVGGEDGTLGSRFEGHPEAHGIRAKTGTLDHVKAISGYADTPRNGRLAFALVVNNFEEPSADITKTIDELVLALLQ